jgi:hypothetical protein
MGSQAQGHLSYFPLSYGMCGLLIWSVMGAAHMEPSGLGHPPGSRTHGVPWLVAGTPRTLPGNGGGGGGPPGGRVPPCGPRLRLIKNSFYKRLLPVTPGRRAAKPATPGLRRRSALPPSPAEGGRPLLPPDDYHPVRQAVRLTNAHVRGTMASFKSSIWMLSVS